MGSEMCIRDSTVTVPGTGIATAGITSLGSVGIVTITSGGSGYTTTPNVAITTAPSGGTDATAEAVMVGGTISAIRISNAGSGYTTAPTITIGAATSIGDGNYIFNETVQVSSDSSETSQKIIWEELLQSLFLILVVVEFLPRIFALGHRPMALS